ncbi:MAG: hypothetical protein AABX23_01720 [Nanoarchaeota archaeon]
MRKMAKKAEKKTIKKTHPKIILTALAALAFVILAFWNWLFIFPAVFLWWINKKEIKKHFGV